MSSEQSTATDGDATAEEASHGTDEADPETGEQFDRDAVAADLRELVTLIEAVHPEPFHGYDGRVDLHATVEGLIGDLPETVTVEEGFRAAARVVAGLDDAHSRVDPPEGNDDDRRLPLSLRTVGPSLYVDEVYDESLDDLLGGELLAVEGVATGRLADRYADLRGAENRYFAYDSLATKVESFDWYDRFLGVAAVPERPTVTVRAADGTELTRSMTPVDGERDPVETLPTAEVVPTGTGPRYTLTDDGAVAVFVPGNLMCYREVVQGALERGAGYTESVARDAYREHFDDEVPDDVDDIVPELPSMVETLTEMVRAMEAAGTESLVVDLRDNPGGDSRFVECLAYVLYGWERLVEGSDWNIALKRRTERHRDRFGVPDSADDEYATYDDNPAGYDFGSRFRRQSRSFEEKLAARRERLDSGAFAEELADETHEGYYEPDRLVVVTTAGTMSSAFAGAALLSEFGADVVGVPSGQAPLSFGEAVEVTLSNTGLSVDVAASMFRWTRDPSDDVLPMACELTPALFEDRYGRRGDAALELGLDWARGAVGDDHGS